LAELTRILIFEGTSTLLEVQLFYMILHTICITAKVFSDGDFALHPATINFTLLTLTSLSLSGARENQQHTIAQIVNHPDIPDTN
jgi:hypothetical protein